jgi:uncharacterized membrane protein YdjX (TVP38/TMEM64 family)
LSFKELETLKKVGETMDGLFDVQKTAEWLRDFGIWAILISILLNIFISLLGVVPSLFLSGANAVVFGLIPGFFVSLAGEVVGAGVSFFLYRWGLKRVNKVRVDRWKWVQKINSADRRKQFVSLTLVRLTPMIPSGMITAVASISNMRFNDFIIASLIGKAPSIAMETIVGHDLILLESNMPRLLFSLLLILIIFLIWRRENKKRLYIR